MNEKKSDSVVREIKRRTRGKYSAEEKIAIVLEGLIGEESISVICRREGIVPNLYYRWSNPPAGGFKLVKVSLSKNSPVVHNALTPNSPDKNLMRGRFPISFDHLCTCLIILLERAL